MGGVFDVIIVKLGLLGAIFTFFGGMGRGTKMADSWGIFRST